MITVSQSQALQRWDTLPQELREALYSEKFSAVVWQAGKNAHIPEEKMGEIAKVIGYIFLGFLHPEDAAQEIRDRLGVDPKLAVALAEEFLRKMFGGYRNLLDQIYAPPGREPREKAAALPISISSITPRMVDMTAETQETKSEGQRTENENIKTPFSEAPVPKPPTQDSRQKSPAPFMLHEEAESKPIERPSESRFELKKEFFKRFTQSSKEAGQTGPAMPPPRPPRPARIEIGVGIEKKKEPQITRAGTSAPRVVHYSEMRTPATITQNREQRTENKELSFSPNESLGPQNNTQTQKNEIIKLQVPAIERSRPEADNPVSAPSPQNRITPIAFLQSPTIKSAPLQPPLEPKTEDTNGKVVDLSNLTIKENGL